MQSMKRSDRVRVMDETLEACRRGSYVAPSGVQVSLDAADIARRVARGRLHHLDEFPPRVHAEYQQPGLLQVAAGDCLLHALELQDRGLDVCCLNMASHKRPGGGYRSGAGAQEENLFRRTNYFQFLEPGPDRPAEIAYPLPEFAGIYSPQVDVLRGSEADGYPLLETPRRMSFVAVAAYPRPPVAGPPGQQRLEPPYDERTKRKIRLILEIALAHEHNALVLSAFGCGAFANPPGHVAQLFREVIEQGGYRRAFRHLLFAIIDDHNARRPSNPRGNLAPFEDELARGS